MKITKRYLTKLIQEQNRKFLKEAISSNNLHVDPPFDSNNELRKAKEFSITPPVHEIFVTDIIGEINDDYVSLEMTMSNGDKVTSDYKETTIYYTAENTPSISGGLSTIKKKFKKDMSRYHGSTNTVVGDILLVYRDFIKIIR